MKINICEDFKSYVIVEREIHGGHQVKLKFDNYYGASIINHPFSYGLELAVFDYANDVFGTLCYDTPITNDVIGHLTPTLLRETLIKIKNLER